MINDELRQTISNNIQNRMNELQITQRTASKVTDVPLSSFNNYASGKTIPSLDAAIKLANGLQMSLDDLVT